MITKLLQHFAISDGLIRGTALTSNLIAILSTAIIPGFGLRGIFVSAAIQLIIMGLLEVPTGIFADRVGWTKSLLFSLKLKIIVSFFFLLAIIAATNGHIYVAWICIAVEAIIDALASSLMNGSYQAAYSNWYTFSKNKLGIPNQSTPSLFLASYKYMMVLRLSLPIIVAGISVLSIKYFQKTKYVSVEYVSIVSFLIIIFLRLFILKRVTNDLDQSKKDEPQFNFKEFDFSNFTKNLFHSIKSHPYIALIFSLSRVLYFLIVFIFVGKIFQYLNQISGNSSNAWIISILLGISLYGLETIVSRFFMHKVIHSNISSWVLFWSLITFSLSCVAFASNIFEIQLIYISFLYFGLCLSSLLLTSTLARYISSNLQHWVHKNLSASWLSFGEGIAALIAGIFNYFLINLNDSLFENKIIIICTGILTLLISFLTPKLFIKDSQLSKKSFKSILLNSLSRSAGVGVFIIALIDILSFSISTIYAQRNHEQKMLQLVTDSIKVPLMQGSYPEAIARLSKMRSSGQILCSSLDVWSFKSNDCGNDNIPLWTIESISQIEFGDGENNSLGKLVVRFDRRKNFEQILFRIFQTTLLYLILMFFLFKTLKNSANELDDELKKILKVTNEVYRKQNLDETEYAKVVEEIKVLEYSSMALDFLKITEDIKKLEKVSAKYATARQVAHDIRSPLTALDMIISKSQNLPEEDRRIVRHAVRRIHDIANNLLLQNQKPTTDTPQSTKIEMLAPIIQSIVSEKRTEYNSQIDINMKAVINSSNFHLFSKIDPSELKRILSNLVNNSIESFPNNSGEITVDFFEKDQAVNITVADNGPGIPNQVIEKLFSQDFQSTKNKGSGIGLKSAKEFLNKINGDLSIESNTKGTTVTIKLPVLESPAWFKDSLEIKPDSRITIIDDDKSIHALWEQRLKNISPNSQITHLSNFEMVDKNQDLLLIDYEFQGETFNGLDKIIELNLQNAVLVTSHYDENEVQTKCLEHKIKIIPKDVAHLIPITQLSQNRLANMILIDDDELIRLTWEMRAQLSGKTIKTFSSFHDFKAQMENIDVASEIFIDSELGADLKGEEVAKLLFEQGYKSLHLCTGYSPEDFPAMPWIKTIRGKAFPA